MTTRSLVPSTRLFLSLALALGTVTLACDRNGADVDPRSDPNGLPGDEDGCTLTQGYWKNHHADAKNPAQQLPWPLPEDTALCGQTWLEILHTPPKGDAWYILAHQYIAASLNVAAGAVAPPDVAAALDNAEAMLADCVVHPAEHDPALDASELLDNFNNGAVGPGHCDDDGDTAGDDTTTTGDDGTTTGDTDGDTDTCGHDHDTEGDTGCDCDCPLPLPIPQ